jgi:diguanylate cyclase (GGDEF)-like protein
MVRPQVLRRLWRAGLPLRYIIIGVVVLGVTTPALIMLTVEQRLAERSLQELLVRSETALIEIGGASVTEPMWVVDRSALEKAANRMLESPQVVAVQITELFDNAKPLLRSRDDSSRALELDAQTHRLNRREIQIVRSGENLGTLVVWFDATYGKNLLQQRRGQMLMLVALQVLASLLVLTPILVSRVLKPIERLKQQASTLVDYDVEDNPPVFHWRRQDELGMLGRHLSRVQEELKALFSQLSTKNAQLQQLAFYDHLTGLPNRSLFNDLVQREMLQARRTQQSFGIFFIDLDRFKAVNDTLGHAAGDELLVEVARRFRETLREVDVVCRQSGDEFLVLLRDISHWQVLGEMAQRILKEVEAPMQVGGSVAHISASIGISIFPNDGQDFETIVKNADIAVYQAKALGRARYSYYHSELNSRLQARLDLEQQLGQAIENGELVLHYQPQVDATTGHLQGLEALVRWQHPERGLLYPAQFIGLAEESGKIAQMGVWTVGEACRQKALWNARGLNVGTVAVNVSALEFRDHRLLESLQTALQTHGVAPQDLEIEITETVLMAETDTSHRIIERLRALGVGIAIDDFGTGYSSLAYLKRLRPNQLKIDQSFVSDAATDSDSRAIIKGVVGLANALGLNVVAEGVETTGQLQFLRESGCHTLQGYYIARPMPVVEMEDWLATRHAPDSLFS